MSEQLSFDRKKGFVALPVDVLDLDLSPGSFRTLVELCRMANLEGWCWPSLDQLGQKLGRSKASISSYLKELRACGLLETVEQRTANGYNYRLKYRVTFWQDWRASLAGKSNQDTEHSVRPTKRHRESKNHIHKNHCSGVFKDNLSDILKDWSTCFRNAPYPTARQLPSDVLIRDSVDAITKTPPPPIISADISAQLAQLWADLNVTQTPDRATAQAKVIENLALSHAEFDQLLCHIRKRWPDHWRKSPDATQLKKLIANAPVTSRRQQLKLLKSYLSRWELVKKTCVEAAGPVV